MTVYIYSRNRVKRTVIAMFDGCSAFNFCLYTMRKGNWSLKDEKCDFYASMFKQFLLILHTVLTRVTGA